MPQTTNPIPPINWQLTALGILAIPHKEREHLERTAVVAGKACRIPGSMGIHIMWLMLLWMVEELLLFHPGKDVFYLGFPAWGRKTAMPVFRGPKECGSCPSDSYKAKLRMFQKIKVNSNLVGEIQKKSYTHQIIPYDIISYISLWWNHSILSIPTWQVSARYRAESCNPMSFIAWPVMTTSFPC